MTAFTPGSLDTVAQKTPTDFATTAAGAMEQKLHDLVAALTGKAPFDLSVDDADARARRVLFVAIAEAVFEHLRDNSAALGIQPGGADSHTHAFNVVVD